MCRKTRSEILITKTYLIREDFLKSRVLRSRLGVLLWVGEQYQNTNSITIIHILANQNYNMVSG